MGIEHRFPLTSPPLTKTVLLIHQYGCLGSFLKVFSEFSFRDIVIDSFAPPPIIFGGVVMGFMANLFIL
ncbi:hypothetical protein GOBAR_DD28104 [Gossypium barbadense]|nr:hypothetical protein GOBAR_DD28104 [Gossypium barbadense]